MKIKSILICLAIAMVQHHITAQENIKPHKEVKTFEIQNFKLESGSTFPNAELVYATIGELNSDSTNVILLQSAFAGNHNSYDNFIGKNKAFDPDKYFIVITNLFSGGISSSPTNTSAPYNNSGFPVFSIRDNVNANYKLLTEEFNLKKIKSVVGFSMGAQQAFQWSVSYPEYMESIIPICGAAKTYPHGYVRLQSALDILELDANFKDGDFDSLHYKTRQAWASHWATWMYSQEWWKNQPTSSTGETIAWLTTFFTDTLIMNLISLSKTWQNHDVSMTQGFEGDLEKALGSIKAKVLYMPSTTDLYFPKTNAEYESQFIPNVNLVPIRSTWGHMAGAGLNETDLNFINQTIKRFLE